MKNIRYFTGALLLRCFLHAKGNWILQDGIAHGTLKISSSGDCLPSTINGIYRGRYSPQYKQFHWCAGRPYSHRNIRDQIGYDQWVFFQGCWNFRQHRAKYGSSLRKRYPTECRYRWFYDQFWWKHLPRKCACDRCQYRRCCIYTFRRSGTCSGLSWMEPIQKTGIDHW